MPYMSVIGIDRQEGQTAEADKDPKRQSGIPKERVKHNAPPLTALPPFALVELRSVRGKDQSVADEGMRRASAGPRLSARQIGAAASGASASLEIIMIIRGRLPRLQVHMSVRLQMGDASGPGLGQIATAKHRL
jgi:hypothetical protein